MLTRPRARCIYHKRSPTACRPTLQSQRSTQVTAVADPPNPAPNCCGLVFCGVQPQPLGIEESKGLLIPLFLLVSINLLFNNWAKDQVNRRQASLCSTCTVLHSRSALVWDGYLFSLGLLVVLLMYCCNILLSYDNTVVLSILVQYRQ